MVKPLFLGVGVLLLDQLTKYGASWFLPIYLNTGISFGYFEGFTVPLLTVFLLGIVLLLFYSFKSIWLQHQYISAVFFGSAISNVVDRVLFGGVRDWLLIPFTNIYNNIADYLIFFAIIWLLYISKVEKAHD